MLFLILYIVLNIFRKKVSYDIYQPYTSLSEPEKLVDIVITWVDSSDEKWRQSRKVYYNLYNEHGSDNRSKRFPDPKYPDIELETVILFILKNILWRRKIFIVTSDGQVPNCYHRLKNKYRDIYTVYHSDIWPKHLLHTLPTFNSHAIECNIHRIQDLTENFIYFNDDIYVTKKLKYNSMFFQNKMIIQPLYFPYPRGNTPYHNVWKSMRKKYNMYPGRHVPVSLNKHIMSIAEKSIQDIWNTTISSRFRSNTDIAPVGYTVNFALQNKMAYISKKPLKIYEKHTNKKLKLNRKNDIVNINFSDNIYKDIMYLRSIYL